MGSDFFCLFSFKEINAFIQQECLKLIQTDSKDIRKVTKKIIFQRNSIFFKFQFIKVSIKIHSQLFSAVIIEMFLEYRNSILN